MPDRRRYGKYHEHQTTIWVGKAAHAFLLRERAAPGEAVAHVLDRLLRELRGHRKRAGGRRKAA